MNKARRKRLDEGLAKLAEAKAIFEECRDEEQEYFDNMPESMQGGDKGTTAETVVGHLENAIESCDEIETDIAEAQA